MCREKSTPCVVLKVLMFAVLTAVFPAPELSPWSQQSQCLVAAAACAQLGRVNSGELLIVRSVLITVMAIQQIKQPAIQLIKPPAVLWGIVHHNDN